MAPAISLHTAEPAEGRASALHLGAEGSTGGCHAYQGDTLCHFWWCGIRQRPSRLDQERFCPALKRC